MKFAIFVALSLTSKLARATEFNVSLPYYSKPISVLVEDSNTVSVQAYPKVWTGSIKFSETGVTSFGIGLKPDVCKTIQSRAALAASASTPSLMKKQAKDSIRSSNSVIAGVDAVPFLMTQEFSAAILKAAQDQGIGISSAYVQNQITLNGADVKLSLKEGAISRLIGEESIMVEQVNKLFSPAVIKFGRANGSLNALDLACDLKSGLAELSVGFKGFVKGPAQGQTSTIIPLAAAESLLTGLLSYSSALQEANSLHRLALQARYVTLALHLQNASLDDTEFDRLFSALVDLETAQVRNISRTELSQMLSVEVSSDQVFDGLAKFSF